MATINYRQAAAAAARRYGYNPDYFVRQIGAESNFNPRARSGAGAIGIAQIMPRTARGWGVNPNDPMASLDAAAKHMADYLRAYRGDYRKALAAYNAGPGSVKKYGGVPPYRETQNYVNKILSGGSPFATAGGEGVGGTTVPRAGSNDSGAGAKSSLLAGILGGRQQGKTLTASVRDAMAVNHFSVADLDRGSNAAIGMVNNLGYDAAPSSAVRSAKKWLGTPYSWGGGTPSGPSFGIGRGSGTRGFDCSALVQYAWAQQGVKIPRTTYGQIKTGKPVNGINNIIPGDLLFPHSGHVQMYIGGGRVIEAPYTGGVVRIVPVRSNYIAIRRPGAK